MKKNIGTITNDVEYVDFYDSKGNQLYLGCKVKSPNIEMLLGCSEKYELMELRKDKDGEYFFHNHSDNCEYCMDFLGFTEIILICDELKENVL